jgi:hypothetical protein
LPGDRFDQHCVASQLVLQSTIVYNRRLTGPEIRAFRAFVFVSALRISRSRGQIAESLRPYANERREFASRLLLLFNQLNELERIVEPEDRLRGRTYAYRFGVTDDEVATWERIREVGF